MFRKNSPVESIQQDDFESPVAETCDPSVFSFLNDSLKPKESNVGPLFTDEEWTEHSEELRNIFMAEQRARRQVGMPFFPPPRV